MSAVVRPDSAIGRLARAARADGPVLRIRATPRLARFLVAAGARPAPADDIMTVGFPSREAGKTRAGFPQAPREETGRPKVRLFAIADIVSYSRLSARLQMLSQKDLRGIIDRGMEAAGVPLGQVLRQDQGDGMLLVFPPGTDIWKVLAVMPRYLNDELAARNQDMAEHAQMRIRLAFVLGAGAQTQVGLVGAAPVAVARLAHSGAFLRATLAAPQAQCSVIIDDYLHGEWTRQGLHADASLEEYVPVSVSYPDKGTEETAWMRLFGYSGQQVMSLLG